MKKSFLLITVLVVAAGLAFPVHPVSAAEFSAEVETIMNFGRSQTTLGKVYVKGKLSRMEMTAGGQLQSISITDLDKKVVYTLNPATKTYMEMDITSQDSQAILDEMTKDKADIVELGNEKVAGYTCKKTKYVYKDKQMGTGTYWFSNKLELPLKYEVENASGTMRSEYRNIKEGTQSSALFKVPPDYKKFTIPNLPPGVKIPGMQ